MPLLADVTTAVLSEAACAQRSDADRVLAILPVDPGMDNEIVAEQIREWHRRVSCEVGIVSAGRSATHAGAAGVRQGVQEAERALSLGERLRGPGGLTAYGDVFALDYAEHLTEDNLLNGVYERILSRLGSFDQSERGDLVATLELFLASGCSRQRTASEMGIHRNTVLYRLKRMEELVGLDFTDNEARFYIQLALRAQRRLASAG